MATEYAECPECLHDGPQSVQGDELECGACHIMFANPNGDA